MDDPIHFECPRCKATHDRGYFDGVDTFRCLRCGYVGHGFHPDEAIDAGIGRDIREAQKWNRDHGLPEGEFAP
jgi:rubredoxin